MAEDRGLDKFFKTKTCPICGKSFVPAAFHVYKKLKNKKMYFYCSYGCYRHAGGGK